MKLSEWCKQKMESAKDGDEAYAYHQLMEMWSKREGSYEASVCVPPVQEDLQA